MPVFANDLIQVDLQNNYAIGLKSDSTQDLWGAYTAANQLGEPLHIETTAKFVSISYGATLLFRNVQPYIIKADGTMYDTTPINYDQPFQGITDIVQVASSQDGTCRLALLENGTVITESAWFSYYNHPISNIPEGLSNVVKIDAGENHALALKADGTVIAWGESNNNSYANMVPSWIENVTDIACGEERNLVLRNDGTVAEWGYNSWQSVPADLENVIAIDCNSNGFNAALKANGDVICWGYDHNNGHFNR